MIATDVIGDIALVIVIAALLAALARRVGQPAVIGQILAGLLLGPSLFGRLPGHLTSHLFPHAVLPSLTALAQVAVVIFMFAVGYELDLRALRGHGRVVPLLASSALALPMGLGIAFVLLFRSGFASIGEPHEGHSFVLFMGVAMSVTAMPVLAAIVREHGLAGTTAGVTATAAAGIMDVLAWLVLAAALIGTRHSGRFSWPVTLLLISCFAAVMLLAARPALAWWTGRSESVLSNPVPIAFALAMGSAWVTASLGLQPVFGGFLAGLTMRPRNGSPDADVLRSMDQAGSLLLPLFFVVTGLSLNVGTVHGDALVILALVFLIAAVGKLVPAYAVSRTCGLEPRQSATVAALVNTRGLTELIALNVALVDGLINQRLFTVLVLMALITTLMTGPLLSWIGPVPAASRPTAAERLTNT
ncbi:MAG: cation:proton antiporter [Streptosporangiaceae bacterium]|nr:cation:proton antiporter [Streptosporangiaceae bacterium]MBV9857602.1 cation:proton antiporter [Streptosporangiaceae bacterium]